MPQRIVSLGCQDPTRGCRSIMSNEGSKAQDAKIQEISDTIDDQVMALSEEWNRDPDKVYERMFGKLKIGRGANVWCIFQERFRQERELLEGG